MCRGAASRQQVRRGSSGVAGSVRTRFSFWMPASGALRFACKVYGSGASRPIASPLPRLVLVPSTPPSTLRTFSVCGLGRSSAAAVIAGTEDFPVQSVT